MYTNLKFLGMPYNSQYSHIFTYHRTGSLLAPLPTIYMNWNSGLSQLGPHVLKLIDHYIFTEIVYSNTMPYFMPRVEVKSYIF